MATRLTGSSRHLWLEREEQEHDNLRAAWQWAVADGHAEDWTRFARALQPFWNWGHWGEGRRALAAALARRRRVPVPRHGRSSSRTPRSWRFAKGI